MAARLYVNNFSTTLNGAVASGDTSITVTSSSGLTALSNNDYYILTIDDGTNVEIIKVTAVTGNVLTVVRAQEGTGATSFADLDDIEMRETAYSFQGDAFSAYRGTSVQSIPNSTPTKVQFNTESFDVLGSYDSTTNYRFTAKRQGHYQINASIEYSAIAADKIAGIYIYKNGALYRQGGIVSHSTTNVISVNISDLVEMNGSTDYIEIFTFHNSGAAVNINYVNNPTYFSAARLI